MTDVPVPLGGVVATVDPSGVVVRSSDDSVRPRTPVADLWPTVELDRREPQALGLDATVTARSCGDETVLDVESNDDELEVLRWLEGQRSAVRDAETAVEATAVVAAGVGRRLGLDAVVVRSFVGAAPRWSAGADSDADRMPVSDGDVSRRWSATEHLVTDLAEAPEIGGAAAERSAIARPPPGVLSTPRLGAIVSMPLRHGGLHHGELVGWASAPIGPAGPRLRAAISELATDVAARSERERATRSDHRDVLGAIGHDLRSPLRAVANYAELLAVPNDPVDDELVAFTSRMQTAARQANEQLDGLVEFLDADAPGPSEELDLERALDQIAASWTSSLSAVTIERRGRLLRPWGRPSVIHALAVLVENSVAVRRVAAPITLEVRTEPMVAGGCRIVLVDDGPGVLRELSAFRWSDGTRSQATVGPLLVRRIVERHGGRLSAEAEPGRSTTWTMELPGA